MEKRSNRYFNGDNRSSSHQAATSKRRKPTDGSAANPESRDFYYDDVDEFHHQRDKVYLDKVGASGAASSDEEVYGIGSDEDDEEMEEDQDQNDKEDDMGSDISQDDDDEGGYLPSADAWGKRRQAYYSTDFAGDDRADLSGSDVEVAELEEQEAVSLQRRLLQQMTADDFKLAGNSSEEPPQAPKGSQLTTGGTEIVQKDLSTLTEEEKFELLKQESPELLPLIDEYQEKSKALEECWEPLANALVEIGAAGGEDSREPAGGDLDEGLYWVFDKYELYKNYLLNLHFYFVLKAMRQSVENHPVIDRIMSLKKLVNSMEEKYGYLYQSAKRLAMKAKTGLSITKSKLRTITFDASRCSRAEIGVSLEPATSIATVIDEEKKRVHWGTIETSDGRNLMEQGNGDDEEEDSGDEDGKVEKRGVTYEIEKNKGLTPKRKKEQRNPRVKNRSRFKKALHKKKSQVPDARREIQKYGGEVRGIKANLVRSVKLH